jgi:hypothetical protein
MRRIAGGVILLITLLAAFGCGSSGTDTSVGTATDHRHSAIVPADDAVSANGLRTVIYRGLAFDVPADWPVYDLDADPSTCVRFDAHAVYLGTPGADMACPAGIVGRSDTVLVEPARGDNAGTGSVAATESGLDVVEVSGSAPAANQVDATIPSAAVDVSLTYEESDATVQQILRSFRAVGQ